MNGYGKILRIDLTTSSVSQEEITPELARQYLGGGGINDWLLWEHFLKVDPRIVDSLVAHAMAGPAVLSERREAAPAPVVEVPDAVLVDVEEGPVEKHRHAGTPAEK